METKAVVKLDDLAAGIELDMASLKNGDKERRNLIIRIGKRLLLAKKQCKLDGVVFADWVQKGHLGAAFGKVRQARMYMAIAQQPGAFKASMSIKEGAKVCRYAKTHGGELPIVEWKGGQNRRLITFQRKVGKSLTAINQMVEQAPKLDALRKEEKWTKDELAGTIETLEALKREVIALLKALKG